MNESTDARFISPLVFVTPPSLFLLHTYTHTHPSMSESIACQVRTDFDAWQRKRSPREQGERFVREVPIDQLSLRERVTLMQALDAGGFLVSLVRYPHGALASVFWVEREISNDGRGGGRRQARETARLSA